MDIIYFLLNMHITLLAERPGGGAAAAAGGGQEEAAFPAEGQGDEAVGGVCPGATPAPGGGGWRGLGRGAAGAAPAAPAGAGGAEEQVGAALSRHQVALDLQGEHSSFLNFLQD